ncbi:MAG: glycosyltransferase family 1 protein [Clostridiaceae bacterium]
MKVAIDCRGINWYKGTGIGTYTDNILLGLLKIDREDMFYLPWAGDDYKKYKKSNSLFILSSKKHHSFFENSYFPKYLSDENIDIYHIPQNGLGLSDNLSSKLIITIHDLIPYIMPETVGNGYLKKFISCVPKSIYKADKIITVSEYSKKDILRYFPVEEKNVHVTPLAASRMFRPMDKEKCQSFIKEKYNINSPFILYIGGFSKRKNVESVIDSFINIYKSLPVKFSLVIAGSGKETLNELKSKVSSFNMENEIIFTGFLEDDMLPVFYNGCSVFVYPSFYEGFGLPPLEAMSCKTPVISSNTSSIPEVVGDSGLLINPYSKTELGDAMLKLLSSESLLSFYGDLGYERSKLFSWEETAAKTLEVYKKVQADMNS